MESSSRKKRLSLSSRFKTLGSCLVFGFYRCYKERYFTSSLQSQNPKQKETFKLDHVFSPKLRTKDQHAMTLNSIRFSPLIVQPYLRLMLAIFVALVFVGCASSKKINYFQNSDEIVLNDAVVNFQPTIQYADILAINISSIEPELAVPFNNFEVQDDRMIRQIPYIVNANGEINFPILGKLSVAGLTTQELTDTLYNKLLKFLNNPTVSVQLTNFKVSVLGEVLRPGAYTIVNERITIPEALALAGDLTIYGKRKTVTLIREQNGTRTFIPIDLTSKAMFNSPYYYLVQNDILYVEANKTRVNASAVGPNTSIIVSSLSILISLAAILIR